MTYYDLLEVIPTASVEVIKMAYKAQLLKYHPDVYQGDKAFAEEKTRQLNDAYKILSTPELRQAYDEMLRVNKQKNENNFQQSHNQEKKEYYTSSTPYQSKSKVKPVISSNMLKIIVSITGLALVILILIVSVVGSFMSEQIPYVAEPESGTVFYNSKTWDTSELTISASSESSCVVKLKSDKNVVRMMFYVRAGDTVTVTVPAAKVNVYFASGETWYGEDYLFGENTVYSMDDEICDFTQYTYEYKLYPVASGNFSQTPIDKSKF